MICVRCDSEDFVSTPSAVIEQEFKGELFSVQTPGLMCSMCGWVTVDPSQADELRRRTADAYRKRHSLLTSEEIKVLRKALGKSQREFAQFLEVGEASVKRWETWLVQDKSNDHLMRLKCGMAIAESLPVKYIDFVGAPMNVANFIATQIRPAAETAPPAEDWALMVDIAAPENESQMCLCGSRHLSGEGPPGSLCDSVAFSLSAPF